MQRAARAAAGASPGCAEPMSAPPTRRRQVVRGRMRAPDVPLAAAGAAYPRDRFLHEVAVAQPEPMAAK